MYQCCLVCNANVNIETSVNINNTSVKYSNQKLVSIVVNILGSDTPVSNDSCLCTKCYSLFKLYEQAQWTAKNTEREILKTYHLKVKKYDEEILDFAKEEVVLDNENVSELIVPEPETGNVELCETVVQPKVLDSQNGRKKTLGEKYSLKNYFENVGKDLTSSSNDTSETNKTDVVAKRRNDVLTLINVGTLKGNASQNASIIQSSGKSKNIVLTLKPVKGSSNSSKVILKNSGNKVLTIVNNKYIDEAGKEGVFPTHLVKCETIKTDAKVIQEDEGIEEVEKGEEEDNGVDNDEMEISNTETVISTSSEPVAKKSDPSEKLSKFYCPSCKKEYPNKVELRNHVKTHSELRPFMCEICGHSYRHKQALQIHIGMHNGINPFQCSHCGKCFTQKGTLMRHMLIHTGEMPYQCEYCGKRFVHHTSYNMHILSHTREKAYKCSMCELSLLSTSHLKRHMRVHTGEKPYSCPTCFKCFAQRYNLLTHQKTHNSKEGVKS